MNIEDALKKYTNPRTQLLLETFRKRFPNEKEVYISHAPGRVNLIGEHIDYNGYGVMPMAVNKEIEVCFIPSEDSTVELYDAVKESAYRTFRISGDIEPFETGDWGNYIKAPCQAMYKWAEENCEERIPLKGFKGVLIGDIPPAAGLSSSSALVVCIGVIISFLNRLRMSKSAFARLMAQGEIYVGTLGGGMDQAASIFGHQKGPMRISFNPVRVKQINMPEGYSFIIANSLKKAKKTGDARFNFNNRSISCKLGHAILKNLVKDKYPDAVSPVTLRRMQKIIGWENIPEYLEQIPKGGMSLEEISICSGISVNNLKEKFLKLSDSEYLPIPKEGFRIYDRLYHVFTEAIRVSAARDAMRNNDMEKAAALMDQSHISCRDYYGISCPEIEELVKCLKNAGTMGSRITGAGWGGCTVSLVRKEEAEDIIGKVWENYYIGYAKNREGLLPVPENKDRNKVIFECIPAEGAGIREIFYASNEDDRNITEESKEAMNYAFRKFNAIK